ncbi:GntR family transcriptional regulator [Streptomyces sp. NBC_01443]|uniref:GntR family transcriptional regulator n=1 Tax=Streptomyces sp. NBC_01443 TaxID=2903868 RepID=UPI00224C95BD|nr:GntR family transcriptional regulator [Streptomyces sp. NBC_01443]MCX4629805.1 GntR family transcriptional regulator [Streptomyces sp. NBC_01443]
MAEQVSPRGTFLKIANCIKVQIAADLSMVEMPSLAEVMAEHGVSRGVALRAFKMLQQEGVAEPVPGARWRVVRAGVQEDRRPLAERIAELITAEKLQAGAVFLSEGELSARLGASRPTISKALAQLESAGLLTEGGQGKRRAVRAVPSQQEDSKS